MHLMDWYSAGYPLFIVALFEILAVIYLYGKLIISGIAIGCPL